jgi:cupin fold WbuC family metalloprotein
MLIPISTSLIEDLKSQAGQSKRLRKNLNFHQHEGDLLQRMLHVMNPGTYVQPHKHENPDKREIFIILEGRVAVIEFDDSGKIIGQALLNHESRIYGVEIRERTWHMLIALEENSVLYEVKDGPWSPSNDKFFASWAPKEGDPECQSYINSVLKSIIVF